MNNNQPQSTSDPKGRAVLSLVLGILGALSLHPVATTTIILLRPTPGPFHFGNIPILYFLAVLFIALSIIFGISGLKSSRKSLAIIGITIGILPLANLILNYLFEFIVRSTL